MNVEGIVTRGECIKASIRVVQLLLWSIKIYIIGCLWLACYSLSTKAERNSFGSCANEFLLFHSGSLSG